MKNFMDIKKQFIGTSYLGVHRDSTSQGDFYTWIENKTKDVEFR